MEITLYDLLLIIIISQCIFLICAIQFVSKKNTSANKILQYLLAIYSLILFERVLILKIEPSFATQYGFSSSAVYFLIGPFIYTYIRRLLFDKNGIYRLNHLHYLPALLSFLYCIFHIYIYDSVRNSSEYFITFSFLLEFFSIVSISFYLVKSISILNLFKKNEKLELSYNQTIVRYVRIMLLFMATCMIIWLISIADRFLLSFFSGMFFTDLIWVLFGIQTYIVGFYSLKQPEIFKIRLPRNDQTKPLKKDRLGNDEIHKLQKLVSFFLEEKKGYMQPEISLSILAKEIGTTPNNLSWLLNNIYDKTFYQLINEYRVKDFLGRIDNNDHKEITIISIALDVGFNSKSTFYKVFKEITKMTPSECIKQIESSKQAEKLNRK